VSVLRIFMYVLGSGLAFAGVNLLVTRGFRRPVESEPRMVQALATSLSVISVSAAVGIVTLLGWVLGGWGSWLLGAVLGTWAYLSVAAPEMAISRSLDPHAEERD
jgi:hypothetical protein